MAPSTIVVGVDKAVKSSAAPRAHSCSATNASVRIYPTLMCEKSRRMTTGRASFATKTF